MKTFEIYPRVILGEYTPSTDELAAVDMEAFGGDPEHEHRYRVYRATLARRQPDSYVFKYQPIAGVDVITFGGEDSGVPLLHRSLFVQSATAEEARQWFIAEYSALLQDVEVSEEIGEGIREDAQHPGFFDEV